MSPAPDITIVTTAWNAGRFLAETIRSVQAQGLEDWEHIVVDDGSTDDTYAVAEAVGDHRLRLIRQENAGQSAAQNAGLAPVRSQYVVMLDADDLLRPDALKRLRSPFETEAELVLTFGHIWLIDQDGRSFGARPRFQATPSRDRLGDMLERNLIASGGAAMIRTKALKAAGGFDPGLKMAQGWECWARLAALGPVAEIGGDAVLEYRLRAGSVARRGLTDPAQSLPAVERMYENPTISARFSRPTLARLRARCVAHLSYMAGHEALRVGDYGLARRHLLNSLRRRPGRAKTWILAVCALVAWIPGPIARRLGSEQ